MSPTIKERAKLFASIVALAAVLALVSWAGLQMDIAFTKWKVAQ